MKTNRQRPGIKHRLKLYERFFSMFTWLTFLLALATYILWWISYDYPVPVIGRGVILLLSVLSWLAFLLCLIAPAFCYVQCHPDFVVVSAIYPLAISYTRIGNTIPINFNTKYPLKQQSWSQRSFLEPLFYEQRSGELTVVGMQLSEYPLPKVWLQLWLNRYMFFPPRDGAGFLFIVRDWMLLSHELEDYRDAWRVRRNSRGLKKNSLASEVMQKGNRKR
jgi:hypothetical protein